MNAKTADSIITALDSDGVTATAAPAVLIVDDSPTIRSGLSRELAAMGCTATQAVDGQHGFEIAQTQQFDLIITDIDMPRMDGFAFCEILKQCPATRSVPVVILSSQDSEADIEKGFLVGAAAFISKANARSELRSRIQEVLHRAFFLRDRLVLVVEDSRPIRTTVEQGLARAGFGVMAAENGKKAMEALKKRRPDLILCDLNMPEMDGVSFLAAVRSREELSGVPFVVMSTSSDRFIIRSMIEQGATGFLEKPFNIEQLVITAEKMLSDHFQLLLKEKERLDAERSTMLGSITSLVQALEARDRYTRGHSDNVSKYSMLMAKQMGFSEEELVTMEMAGRLHDLGKIGVRDKILLKPGPLTKKEFSLMKKHPIIGAEILGSVQSLAPIIPGVLYHHERMNGNGYPNRLTGARIPLLARIIAVADTFDSLTTDRPYQKRYSREIAMQIIEDSAPDELCPECVRIFLDCM